MTDLDGLRRVFLAFFETQLRELQAGATINPFFHVVTPEEGRDVLVGVDGSAPVDDHNMQQLADRVREAVRRERAVAVMYVVDSYFAEPAELEAARSKVGYDIGISEAMAKGLIPRKECLSVIIQSPIMHEAIMQFYEKKGDQVVLGERRREVGESAEGRFSFFEGVDAHRA